jgi:hypothetical protein
MLNIAIGHGMDAREVGRCRVDDVRPIDGAVADMLGVVAGTTTGAVAGTTTGEAAGTPGMDAREVGRCRVDDVRRIDLEGEGAKTVRVCHPALGRVA